MSKATEYIALEDSYGAHNYHPLDVVINRADGVWVWDVDGKRYMDFLAAYSAVNQGHCHPRLVKVMAEQMCRVALTSRAFRNDQLGPFCKEICELTGFARMLPMNTGAEAVETAVKAARKWGYTVKGIAENQAEILVFDGNFHGRTTTIVSFSADEDYRAGFGPFTPGFRILPYGDLEAVKEAMNPNVCAVLVEPIQGEAGIVAPPEGFLAGLRELTTENNCLLVCDEIQSGLGRTGRLFAYEHENVRPDIVIIGKALSGGMYPVSAILADDEVMGVFQPGEHGSTYGGNPLGAAVAREALRVLVDEGMVERSAILGGNFMEKLRAISSPHVELIRGKGLWIGIVLKKTAGGARRFCEALQEAGLLCKETHETVIRIAPPLTINEDEIDWAVERIERVIDSACLGCVSDPASTMRGPRELIATIGPLVQRSYQGSSNGVHLAIAVLMMVLVNAQLTWWIIFSTGQARERLELERTLLDQRARDFGCDRGDQRTRRRTSGPVWTGDRDRFRRDDGRPEIALPGTRRRTRRPADARGLEPDPGGVPPPHRHDGFGGSVLRGPPARVHGSAVADLPPRCRTRTTAPELPVGDHPRAQVSHRGDPNRPRDRGSRARRRGDVAEIHLQRAGRYRPPRSSRAEGPSRDALRQRVGATTAQPTIARRCGREGGGGLRTSSSCGGGHASRPRSSMICGPRSMMRPWPSSCPISWRMRSSMVVTRPRFESSFGAEDDCALLEVSDNGDGIPEGEIPFIFDRFYRAGDEMTRTSKGTGLGLYLVQRIMKAHHGTVAVAATGRDGTTMRAHPVRGRGGGGSRVKKHILIVEDEEHLAEALAHNLQFEGYSTTVANDGEEGLRLAQSIHPDLIILDIMMPKLDGLEVCRRLRSSRKSNSDSLPDRQILRCGPPARSQGRRRRLCRQAVPPRRVDSPDPGSFSSAGVVRRRPRRAGDLQIRRQRGQLPNL